MNRPEQLAVVIPVYNEEAVIRKVLLDWTEALDGLGMEYAIHAYNDGSGDDSLAAMRSAAEEHPAIHVHDKANSGHGPTILQGYLDNLDHEWIFQTDSDDEMRPQGFAQLWELRDRYDFLLGTRKDRQSPAIRKVISWVSRSVVRLMFGRGIHDVNSPFRLMRSSSFASLFRAIPRDTFAPNIIVSGMAAYMKLRICERPVPYRPRQTGTVSINGFRLLKKSAKAFFQVLHFRMVRAGGVKYK